MCRICGDPTCGTVDRLSAAAQPISDAVAVLKAAGYKAIGVAVMAHESKGAGPTIQELGEQAAAAHAAQHGTPVANENLKAAANAEPDAAEEVETDASGDVVKAQAKAEDKAAKGPKD